MTDRLPVAGPWITSLEVEYAADAAANGWYERAGEYPARFEAALAAYVGRRRAISLPSCTAGLHLALASLGIGPGDEVVVPDITWIATSAPVTYVGAQPVFVDVDRETWCLTTTAVADAITDRTKAVIAVDLYGSMPEMSSLTTLLDDRGIALIEDAAEAAGSTSNGTKAGAFGAISVFSFHGSKTVTTGEGGMLLTDDDGLADRVLMLRDHGRVPSDPPFLNREVAFKYKMSPLQAALGLAQVERVEELVERKRQIFGWYAERLADLPVRLNAEPAATRNAYWMVTAIFDEVGLRKEDVAEALAAENIDTRPFFHPLSALPAYADHPGVAEARQRNVVSYSLSPFGLNLPSALRLEEPDVDRVCSVLRPLLKR